MHSLVQTSSKTQLREGRKSLNISHLTELERRKLRLGSFTRGASARHDCVITACHFQEGLRGMTKGELGVQRYAECQRKGHDNHRSPAQD